MSDEITVGMKRRPERFPRTVDHKKFGDELDRIYKKGKYAPKSRKPVSSQPSPPSNNAVTA